MKVSKIIVLALFIGSILGNIRIKCGEEEEAISRAIANIQKNYDDEILKPYEHNLEVNLKAIKEIEGNIKQTKSNLEKSQSQDSIEYHKSQLVDHEKRLENAIKIYLDTIEIFLKNAESRKNLILDEIAYHIQRIANLTLRKELDLKLKLETDQITETISKKRAQLEEEIRLIQEEAKRLKEEIKIAIEKKQKEDELAKEKAKIEAEAKQKEDETTLGKQKNIFRDNIRLHYFKIACEILSEIESKNQTNDFFKSIWDPSFDINSKDKDENTILIVAAMHGLDKFVTFLLENGADANVKGEYERTVFFYLNTKNIAIILIDWLKKNGLNPAEYLNDRDLDGNTPLMVAAMHSATESLKILLDNGANINARNNAGRSFLHFIYANPKGISYWIEIAKTTELTPTLPTIDEYYRTPLYCALEEGEDVTQFTKELEKQNAPLFGTNSEGQPVFPYATNNPAILVKALTEAVQKQSSMDEESQQRILGEILLPSILFQHQVCLPLIIKDPKLLQNTKKLFKEFAPKRVDDFFEKTINDAKKNIPQVPLHHLAIFIDKDDEWDVTNKAMSVKLTSMLKQAGTPCLVIGGHVLKHAATNLHKEKFDFEKNFYFFTINDDKFFPVLVIPKNYAARNVSDKSLINLSNLSWLRSLGFNPKNLVHKKFANIDFSKEQIIPTKEFGEKTINLVKNVLTNVKERGRIVYVSGHGYSYIRQKIDTIYERAVNLPLNAFFDLIRELEEKGTLFTHVLTCYMGGDNLSALEKVMINDFYNTTLATMLDTHQKTKSTTSETHNKMFLSVASTADVSTSGDVDTNLFFPAVDTFFNLLRSDAVKDMMPNLFTWLTRMFRTVGVRRDIVNYPQIRIPGNQTSFYLADIHGDLQIINRMNTMQDRFTIAQKGDKKVVKINKPKDIVVTNKNVLVTYIDHVENKVIIEDKVPVILAMGTNEYFRTFSEIFVDIPEMDFFNFAYNSFYPADFGEEMGHRETYLMKKLTFANEDIFEDIDVPQEIASQKPQTLYNVYLKRGLEEKAAVIFSLGQNPTDDVFEINEDKVVRKLEGEEKELYLARVSAMQAEVGHYFSPLEEKLLKNSALFLQENKQDLAKVFKTALVKSVVLSGRDCDKLLLSYLKLLDTTTDEEILTSLKELLPFLMQNYKEIPSWTLLEKMKFVILSFKELKKETVETFEKIIDKLFEFDEKNKKALKDLLKKITVK
ncbi:TPA: hypothetical protein DEA20_04545 [Candidatus Dependentiae bacterium]|nr:hypothetical protein [Candidatus Dependentiae bacterium]